MSDAPKPGRAKPVPEQFEILRSDPTAHLTEEQKGWKAKLRPVVEQFSVLTPQPVLVLKLHLRQKADEPDQVALAADICGLIQALSDGERELGGSGLILADQRLDSGAVTLTLRPVQREGATERAAQLVEILNYAVAHSTYETTASVLTLLSEAINSPAGRVRLLLAGSHTLSRCEVLTAAA